MSWSRNITYHFLFTSTHDASMLNFPLPTKQKLYILISPSTFSGEDPEICIFCSLSKDRKSMQKNVYFDPIHLIEISEFVLQNRRNRASEGKLLIL